MNFKNKLFNWLLVLSPSPLKYYLKKIRLAHRLVNLHDSYLVETGYVNSRLKREMTDKNGDYIPWFNYPFIHVLKEKLLPDTTVFEYGSGASTVFFSKRVKKVISIEYDKVWYDKVIDLIKEAPNTQLHYIALDETNYPHSIETFGKNQLFDLIVIDGRMRVKCALASYRFLSEKGMLILDDSGREKYNKIFEFYRAKGFNELTFKGIKPTGIKEDHTTLFYKSGQNCLNI